MKETQQQRDGEGDPEACHTSVTSSLEKCVDKGGESRSFSEHGNQSQQQKNGNNWTEPPFLPFTQECTKFLENGETPKNLLSDFM